MLKQIALRQAGGSVAATLPKEVVQRLRVAAGDTLFLVETERGFLLTPYDPNFERAMQVYERGATTYRNALAELAK
jgi:putative addiction module antidote